MTVPPVALITGVILLDAVLAADVPFAFVAVTVKVYAVPFVNPVTVSGEEAPDAVNPPGEEVTVKEVIEPPPVTAAVTGTDAVTPSPASVGVPTVGASGTSEIALPLLVTLDVAALLIATYLLLTVTEKNLLGAN